MAKISTYAIDSNPQLGDKVIGTSLSGPPNNNTANFTFQSILDLFQPEITLQKVVDAGNVVNLAGDDTEAMIINMSASPTVGQKGIRINMPTQTAGSFPNGDCFVAIINGQNPQALANYVSGFYAIGQSGADNYSFVSEHSASVSSSFHFIADNFTTATSDFAYFKSNSLLKFKIDYLGSIFSAADANINSLTIGRGSGNVTQNTAIGGFCIIL